MRSIPREVIEKAVEGGWEEPKLQSVMIGPVRRFGMATAEQMLSSFIVLDSSFWIALGKALSWNPDPDFFDRTQTPKWMQEAHRCYRLILAGGDMEKFWKAILS